MIITVEILPFLNVKFTKWNLELLIINGFKHVYAVK